MREASLRSLGNSLNVSTPDTNISPLRRVREFAEKTIIDTFDVVGRAG